MKEEKTLNRLWGRIRIPLISTAISLIILGAATILADITISSVDVLQSLIQAEATILGFLGVILAYLLASYDARLDRLEQQRFDIIKMLEDESKTTPHLDGINIRMMRIRRNKKDIALGLGAYSVCLVVSLVISIITLGMKNSSSSFLIFVSSLGLGLFFMGIVGVMMAFIQISREA